VRTEVHAVKFQTLHAVALISAKCSVCFVATYAIFLWLTITLKMEEGKVSQSISYGFILGQNSTGG
jgi:hypothetical protein